MSRRFRPLFPVLSVVSVLCLLATGWFAAPAKARTPYERQDASEGDPGDGVLSPQLSRVADPTASLPTALPLLPILRLPGTDLVLCLLPASYGPVPALRLESWRWREAPVAASVDLRAGRCTDAP